MLTVLLSLADLGALANFSKLVTMTLIGFWFLTFFESVLWVALVAAVIPLVDAFSVWRGPTRHIVDEEPQIFTTLSFAFRIPGERQTANLGLPDLLFFALFLAATARFGLRPGWTWLAMTASFGLTIVLTVAFDVIGLPALPLLSVAFLAVNADLIWRALKRRDWGTLTGASEQRDRLHVGRVREHVHGRDALQLELPVACELLHVAGERRGVARDVDEPFRLEPSDSADGFAGQACSRRVDHDDVRRAGALGELFERAPDLAREERGVGDPVQLRVLDRAGDGLLAHLDAPDRERVGGEREPDRADPAVEVVDRLVALDGGRLARELVEALGHAGVGLQERVGADAETQAEQLLLDRLLAPEQRRGQVRDLRRRVVDRPVDRAHLGEAAERVDELVALEALPGAVTSMTSTWPVLRPSRTTRWRR